MMPEAHFAFSLIVWNLLHRIGIAPDYLSLFIVLGIGVGIDIDIIFVRPHRISFLHYPLTWVIVGLIFSYLSVEYTYIIIASSLGHFILDSIDWTVYWLAPFSMRGFGLKIHEKNSKLDPHNDRLTDFIKEYYKDMKMILIEITLLIMALIICII